MRFLPDRSRSEPDGTVLTALIEFLVADARMFSHDNISLFAFLLMLKHNL
ncbi:hypothetical protein D4519_23265 [Salmonella enterica subsp. enterica serovar Enteritidis]|uniref:Uncharacterized protein n=3 Tax=Salmonella enterica I TaxID=59201 RepID=A0A3Y7NFF3_SALEN|nr:hypothetical protein [Salmonella enterica]EAA0979115.1 hypothetical protein [Escherichia coli]EAA1869661.1 hypothetical protein [Salmonella enterica subsp. enterica serovar Typhimurium]EAA5063454.1 hypothetical protein [Salmonella enterica subsp. enterica serovar Enteritidis]EAA5563823.1 hypothetical protein [Salmonella enterica subsp. enterica]EAU2894327.1 hypothetical protein [Salmonella enterica subsp. enterica serovar 4,[5],12:i:-]EBH8181128.1 hypothetical protein [Salmonella enterica 